MFAQAAYSHFQSDYLHTKFAKWKRNVEENAEGIKEIAAAEKENTQELLSLLYQNACIGFEASNHYYYTDRNLIEKILLMEQLI